tara:strand:- start:22 stop:126 length:105 start_codon:yes stop_codon:yes gene_type:complete
MTIIKDKRGFSISFSFIGFVVVVHLSFSGVFLLF